MLLLSQVSHTCARIAKEYLRNTCGCIILNGMPEKNPAAVAMAKKRWEGKSEDEKRENAEMMLRARWGDRKKKSKKVAAKKKGKK